MNWFVNKLGPNPSARNAANGASRTAAPAQKGASAQKNAPAPKASVQRAAAPPPAPEPDKKKKKGWF
ncbi:hypothetical protein [Terricaulis silvestris]|uniref:Uncharacterized protein n=1 Tax=Terricaulis silvestris TaxID=2686094 RepID=A0A6I6MTW3_9CAUL|nr:hypothetical protein [Terricaulis silvestris]QGZ96896.1 hypothetical protein DSM104635_03761 [Terricaulis silvestris]